MATWVAHLALAKKLEPKLDIKDKNEFFLGNILPDLERWVVDDLSISIPYKITHYAKEILINNKQKECSISIDDFYKLYKKNIKKDIVLGYFIHLIIDNYLNNYIIENKSVYKNYEFKGVNLDNGEFFECNEITRRILKHKEYNLFDEYIRNNIEIANVEFNFNMINSVNEFNNINLNEDDIQKIINKSKELSIKNENYNKNEYSLFSENTLIKLFNNVEEHILQILKEKEIIK